MATEHLGAFSIPSTGVRTDESGGDQHRVFVGPGGQTEGGVVSAKIFDDYDLSASTPSCSGNSGVRFDSPVSSTCHTFRGPFRIGHASGAGRRLEPAGASMTSTTSVTSSPRLNCAQSEIKCNSENDASRPLDATHVGGVGVSDSPETSMSMPHSLGDETDNEQGASNVAHGGKHARCGVGEGLFECVETTLTMRQVLGEGMVEEVDDLDVDAADWLDATHALMDVVHEPDQEGTW